MVARDHRLAEQHRPVWPDRWLNDHSRLIAEYAPEQLAHPVGRERVVVAWFDDKAHRLVPLEPMIDSSLDNVGADIGYFGKAPVNVQQVLARRSERRIAIRICEVAQH